MLFAYFSKSLFRSTAKYRKQGDGAVYKWQTKADNGNDNNTIRVQRFSVLDRRQHFEIYSF